MARSLRSKKALQEEISEASVEGQFDRLDSGDERGADNSRTRSSDVQQEASIENLLDHSVIQKKEQQQQNVNYSSTSSNEDDNESDNDESGDDSNSNTSIDSNSSGISEGEDEDDSSDDSTSSAPRISEYERLREERIRRNQQMLKELGLEDDRTQRNQRLEAQRRKRKRKSSLTTNDVSGDNKDANPLPIRNRLGRASKDKQTTYADTLSLRELVGPRGGKLNSTKNSIAKNPRIQKGPSALQRRVPLVVYKELKRIRKERKDMLLTIKKYTNRAQRHVQFYSTAVQKAERKLQIQRDRLHRKQEQQQRQLQGGSGRGKEIKNRRAAILQTEREQLGGKTQQECWQILEKSRNELYQVVVDFEKKEGKQKRKRAELQRQQEIQHRQEELQTKLRVVDAVYRFPVAYREIRETLNQGLDRAVPPDPAQPRRSSRRHSVSSGQDTTDMNIEMENATTNEHSHISFSSPHFQNPSFSILKPAHRLKVELAYMKYAADPTREASFIKNASERKAPPNVGGWISPSLSQVLDRNPQAFQANDLVLYYPGAHKAFLEQHPDIWQRDHWKTKLRTPLWERALQCKAKLESTTREDDGINKGDDFTPIANTNASVHSAVNTRQRKELAPEERRRSRRISLITEDKDEFLTSEMKETGNVSCFATTRETRQKSHERSQRSYTEKKVKTVDGNLSTTLPSKRKEGAAFAQSKERGREVVRRSSRRSSNDQPSNASTVDPRRRGHSVPLPSRTIILGDEDNVRTASRAARKSRFQGTFKVPGESVRDLFQGSELSAKIGTKKENTRRMKLAEERKRSKSLPPYKKRKKISLRKLRKITIKIGTSKGLVIDLPAPLIRNVRTQVEPKRGRGRPRNSEADFVDPFPASDAENEDADTSTTPVDSSPELKDNDEDSEDSLVPWWTDEWINGLDFEMGRYPILCRIEQVNAEFPYDENVHRKVDRDGSVIFVEKGKRKGKPKLGLCLKLCPLHSIGPPDEHDDDLLNRSSKELPLPPKFKVLTFRSETVSPFLIPFANAFLKAHCMAEDDFVTSIDASNRPLEGKIVERDCTINDRMLRDIDHIFNEIEKCSGHASLFPVFGVSSSEPVFTDAEVLFLLEFFWLYRKNRANATSTKSGESSRKTSLLHLVRCSLPYYNGIGIRREAFHRKLSYASCWDLERPKFKPDSFYSQISNFASARLSRHGALHQLTHVLATKLRFVVEEFLRLRPEASAFSQAVDASDEPNEPNAPNYFCAVPLSMYFDLTISRLKPDVKTNQCYYTSAHSLLSELQWILDNCHLYNSRESPLYNVCSALIPVIKKEVASTVVAHQRLKCNEIGSKLDHEDLTSDLGLSKMYSITKGFVNTPFDKPLDRAWLQSLDFSSLKSDVSNNWIPQSGDMVAFDPQLYKTYVESEHCFPVSDEEAVRICVFPKKMDIGTSIYASVVYTQVVYPSLINKDATDNQGQLSPYLSIGLLPKHTKDEGIGVVFWRPQAGIFLKRVTKDDDAVLDEKFFDSVDSCLNVLKHRCLKGIETDWIDPRLSIENLTSATLSLSLPPLVPKKTLPTFESLFAKKAEQLPPQTSVETRGIRKPVDVSHMISLSEKHFLPPWAMDKSLDDSRKKIFANFESILPNPIACLELVRIRTKNGWYRHISGIVNDIQEAYVSTILLILHGPSRRSKNRVSARKIARFLSNKSHGDLKGIEQAPGIIDEECQLLRLIEQVRRLYTMAILCVTENHHMQVLLRISTSKGDNTPLFISNNHEQEDTSEDSTKKDAARRIRYFLAATGRERCENEYKDFGSLKVRITVTNNRIRLKHKATNKIVHGIKFGFDEYSHNDELAQALLRRHGKRASCARCQIFNQTFYTCRVVRAHSNPDFDFMSNWKEFGGVKGLLRPFKDIVDGRPTSVQDIETLAPVSDEESIPLPMQGQNCEKKAIENSTEVGTTEIEIEEYKASEQNAIEHLDKINAQKTTAESALQMSKATQIDIEALMTQPVRLTKDFIDANFPVDPSDGRYIWCTICGLSGDVLCCDGCVNVVHPACVGLKEVPANDWFCEDCRKKEKVNEKQNDSSTDEPKDQKIQHRLNSLDTLLSELKEKQVVINGMSKRSTIQLGMEFYRAFPGIGIFKGKVVRFPNEVKPFYRIEYEDGDEEDMEENELLSYLKSKSSNDGDVDNPPANKRKRGRPRKVENATTTPYVYGDTTRIRGIQKINISDLASRDGQSPSRQPPSHLNRMKKCLRRGWNDIDDNLFFDGILEFGAGKKKSRAWWCIAETLPSKRPKQVFDQLYWFFHGRRQKAFIDYLTRKGMTKASYLSKQKRSEGKVPLAILSPVQTSAMELKEGSVSRPFNSLKTKENHGPWLDDEYNQFFDGIERYDVSAKRDESWRMLADSIPSRKAQDVFTELIAFFHGNRDTAFQSFCQRRGFLSSPFPAKTAKRCDIENESEDEDENDDSSTGTLSPWEQKRRGSAPVACRMYRIHRIHSSSTRNRYPRKREADDIVISQGSLRRSKRSRIESPSPSTTTSPLPLPLSSRRDQLQMASGRVLHSSGRLPRRCRRCVAFGGPAVECRGSKGRIGQEGCEHFHADGRPRDGAKSNEFDNEDFHEEEKNMIVSIRPKRGRHPARPDSHSAPSPNSPGVLRAITRSRGRELERDRDGDDVPLSPASRTSTTSRGRSAPPSERTMRTRRSIGSSNVKSRRIFDATRTKRRSLTPECARCVRYGGSADTCRGRLGAIGEKGCEHFDARGRIIDR